LNVEDIMGSSHRFAATARSWQSLSTLWQAHWITAVIAIPCALGASSVALATNGIWTSTTSGGLWSDATKWSGGIVADGTDGIADFSTLDITADDIVHLDSARTIGTLKFGDTTPSNNWILDNNGNAADVLTLAVSTGSPTITVNNDMATISAALAGTQGLTKSGAGTLLLGSNDTFTGLITVSAGALALGNAGALGTTANTVTVASGATLDLGGQTIGSNALTIQGIGVGGNGALINSSTTAATFAGTITASGAFTVGGTGDITLSGSVNNGSNTLTKIGNNTLTLSGTTDNNNLVLAVNSGTVALAKTSSVSVHAVGIGGLTVNGGSAQLGGTGGDQIFDSGNVTVTSGAFDTNGQNETFFTLKLQGTGIGGAGALTNTAAASSAITPTNGTVLTSNTTIGVTQAAGGLTLNNAISGNFALTTVGLGTLTLTGNNTFSGGLAVTSGTLAIPTINNAGTSGPLGKNSSVTLAAFGQTGTLEYAGADATPSSNMPFMLAFGATGGFQIDTGATDLTLGGVIGGGGALVKTGPGTLTLSGTNTFSGGLSIQNGTLQVFTVNNASTSGPLGYNSGIGLGSGGQTGSLELSGVTSASSNMPFTLAAGGTGGFQVDTASAALFLTGVVSGSGLLSKTGLGVLVLSGNDTFSGGATVNAGTLAPGSANALGAPTNAVTIASGATLDLDGQMIGTNALSIQGTGVGGNGAIVNSSMSAASLTGTVTAPAPFTVGGTGDIMLSGSVNTAFNALTKIGSNTLTLSGTTDNADLGLTVNSGTVVLAKTSSGSPNDVHAVGGPGATVNGGTLQLGGTGGDEILDSTFVTLTSGEFDTNGRSETFSVLNLQGTGIGNAGALVNSATGASNLTLTGGVILTNNATVGGTGDVTLNGSVYGNSSYTLTKIGNNTLTLSGATDNSHLQVAVTGGIVVLAKTSSHSPDVHAVGDLGLTVSGGVGQLGGTGGDQIYDFSNVTVTSGAFETNGRSETFLTLNLQGTGIGNAGALVNTAASTSAITPTNGTVLTGNATIGVTQSAGRLALNNAISGNFAFTKVGLGTLILIGNNTFTGGVTINAGTLALANDGALNSAAPNSVAFGPGSTGILDVNGHSVSVGGLTTDANVGTPVVKTSVILGQVFPPFTVNVTGANTFGGAIDDLNLVKTGSGTLTLSGTTDNFNLSATVSAGTLVLAKTSSGAPNDVHAIGEPLAFGQPDLAVSGGTAQLGSAAQGASGGDQIYDFASVAVTSGAFDANGQSETFATLNLQGMGIGNAGALVNTAAAASTITPTNGTVLTGNTTIGVSQSNGSLTLNNGISGNFALTKVGPGTLILGGNNTFTGGVTISTGTLTLGNAGALGPAGGAASVASGATLDLGGQTVGANGLTIQGTGVGGNGALVNSGASAASFAGPINASATGNSFSVGGPGDFTLSGASFGTLTKSGSNTLTLDGSTDNTGLAVTVAGGTVVLAKTSTSSPDVHAIGSSLTISGGTAQLGGTGGDQIYDLANVTVTNGTFDTNGRSETFGALSLQGFGVGFAGALQDTAAADSTITPNGGTTVTANTLVGVAQGGSLTLNNAVVGSFSLVMLGPGTLTLTGNNTFSGGLTVEHGTLRVPTVNNASTSGPLGRNASVSLGYTFGGTGTLEYSGANATSNMPLTMVSPFQAAISGGIIQIDSPASTLTLSGVISGGGALSLYGPGTLALTGTNTFSGGLSVESGTLSVAAVNSGISNGPLGTNLTITLGSSGQTGTLEYSGIFSGLTNKGFVLAAGGVGGFQIDLTNLTLIGVYGAGGLSKSGHGTLTLSGLNNFTGGVTINAGSLVLNNAGALNSSSPNAVAFGPASTGSLDLDGNSVTISGLASDPITGSPTVENGTAGSSSTLTINTTGANTFGGVLEDGGATLAVVLAGGGTQTLLGNNTFSGGLTVQNGTLQIFAINNASSTGPLGNNPGVVLGASGQTGTIEYSGASASSTMRFALASGGSGAFQVDTPTTNLALTGVISGSGALSKTGPGTLTLSGNNTFSGPLTVSAGTLALGGASALGAAGNAVTVASGATFDLGGQTIGANPLTIQGTGVGGNGALVNSSNTAASFAGLINGSGFNRSFSVGGTGDINLSGSINDLTLLTKIGFNTLTLSGTTDNVGLSLNVAAGTVILAKTSSHSPDVHAVGWDLPLLGMVVSGGTAQLGGTGGDQIYDSGTVTVTSGAFDTNGRNETFAALQLQGTGIGNTGALVNSATAASTITPTSTLLTGNTTIGVSQSSGSLTLNHAVSVSGGVGLTKVGAGTLVISGDPTWNANSGLLINGGTLRFNVVSGVATIGTGVTATVNSGAALELAGSVSALSSGANRVNVSNGSSAPGLLVSGTHQQVGNIEGSGTTQVNAGSDLTANHIIQSVLVIGGTSGSPALVTIDASDASGNPLGQTGGFASAGSLTPSGPIGVSGTTSGSLSSGVGGGIDLSTLSIGNSPGLSNSSPVPEPSTLLLVLLAVLGLFSTHFARNHCRCQAV
jgi:fibronectin-binding autotransporter adhesin